MKKVKKVILRIVTILILLSMAGCANGTGNIETNSSDENGNSGGIMQSLLIKTLITTVGTIILPIPFIPLLSVIIHLFI
ncbi:MAG: hypothetical protein FWD24_00890 [Treponema sp.]|nr:hypothetical protein [Treponema sp.]